MRTETTRTVAPFNFLMAPELKLRLQAVANFEGRSMGRVAEDAIGKYIANKEGSGHGPRQTKAK